MLVIVIGQLPQNLLHPGPQQLNRAGHQGQRRHLGVAGQPRPRRTGRPAPPRWRPGPAGGCGGSRRRQRRPHPRRTGYRCVSGSTGAHRWNGEGVGGSQAPVLHSSWGTNNGRPSHPAWAATSLAACSSRTSAPPACLLPADPAHRADVMLPQAIAPDRLSGGIHPLACQQGPDAGGAIDPVAGTPGRAAVADHASVSGAINVRTTLTRPSRIVRISIPRATGLPGGPRRHASAALSVPTYRGPSSSNTSPPGRH